MKRTFIPFILTAGVLLAQNYGQPPDALYLRKGWTLQSSADTGHSYPVSVPTTVLAALVENKVYPDPFYGLNLKSIPGYRDGRWLAMPQNSPFRVPWWYRTEFVVPANYRGKHVVLHLDGINYQANVWLNGKKIGDSKTIIGMFRRFEFPVTGLARPGEKNKLEVEIIPPGLIPDKPYLTKQLEATTGWDDHNPQPPDLNMGIWQDVYLTASGSVMLRHPYVASKLDLPSMAAAHLTISAELTNVSDRAVDAELVGAVEKLRVAAPVRLAPGEKKVITLPVMDVAKPRVWWPHPLGPQELYDLRLTCAMDRVASDAATVRFGIREATSSLDQDGWRRYEINGRPILIRGGAWMTSDMLLRLTPRRYEALVRYAREANLNMLRSEGFSIRETDEFYAMCDRYGVMVTQQIFGRSIPDEKLAVSCIEDMLLRIRNHPSLVHFLGHDETFPTPTLDKAYRELLAKYTPDRTYQPHSGAFDVNERRQTGGTRTGTRELWTYAGPGHYYLKKNDGAWGFAQSGGIGGVVAPIESMRRMMPAKDLWPPFSEAWSFHTVTQGGRYFDALVKALEARYGKPDGIEDFCRKAQAMNYECARGMFEAYGRNKYAASGITTWKYDAAWPASPTWQYIDWYLIAGGAYYGAKKACEPLHVQYSYDDRSIWVVNSYRRDFRGLKASARIYDLDLKERFAKSARVDVGPDGKVNALAVEWPKDISKTFFLDLKLEDSAGKLVSGNLYWLSTLPDTPGKPVEKRGAFGSNAASMADLTALNGLPRTAVRSRFQFTAGSGRGTVENTGKAIAFQVHLAVTKGPKGEEVSPAYWSDNYFTLLPGERREVRVDFAPSDLGGASPAFQLDGWNVESR